MNAGGRPRSRRGLFLSIVVSVLLAGWGQAIAHLEETRNSPFDGSPVSANVMLAFTTMGLVIGVSVGLVFIGFRSLIHRAILSGLLGAATVTFTVVLLGIDSFSAKTRDTGEITARLDYPEMWGLAFGGPVCLALAVAIHVLRNASGRFWPTMAACAFAVLAGLRAQWEFWELWGNRACSGMGGCGTAIGNWIDSIAGRGRSHALLFALCVPQAILALDLGARLSAPGALRTLLRRLRLHLRKDGAS
jgi:hypothetical protein